LDIKPQKICDIEDSLADRRDRFPGVRGAKGDILSKAGERAYPESGETLF
jgi:hypothetical protein